MTEIQALHKDTAEYNCCFEYWRDKTAHHKET